jgi:tetratricopeptide (TPR) repeat protein
MKSARYLLTAVALTLVAVVAPAQPAEGEKHLLEMKFVPGRQSHYTATGKFAQSMQMEGNDVTSTATLTGIGRSVTVEVDPETGAALVGDLKSATYDMEAKTAEGDEKMTQTMTSFHAGRLTPSGRSVPRLAKGEGDEAAEAMASYKKMMLSRVDFVATTGDVLPEGLISVGDSWEYVAPFPIAMMPLDCHVTSTLAEVKEVEGRKCAIIKSAVASSKTDEEDPFSIGEVAGTIDAVFDMERRLFQQSDTKLTLKLDGPGMSGEVALDLAVKFESLEELAEAQFNDVAQAIRALDSAVALVYQDETDKAIETLEAAQAEIKDEEWQKGFEQSVDVVRSIARTGSTDFSFDVEEFKPDSPEGIMFAADTAVDEENWAEAVAKYRELLEKHPDNAMLPEALTKAAAIAEEKLGDKQAAEEFRQRLLDLRKEKAAGEEADPMEIYKLASSYADAGDLEKAIATYREFLAVENADIPANRKAMAQWRLAGLLEQIGKAGEAKAAYQALVDSPAEDAYAKKLKERAQAKIEELGAN